MLFGQLREPMGDNHACPADGPGRANHHATSGMDRQVDREPANLTRPGRARAKLARVHAGS
jgi:hypothetical protein